MPKNIRFEKVLVMDLGPIVNKQAVGFGFSRLQVYEALKKQVVL